MKSFAQAVRNEPKRAYLECEAQPPKMNGIAFAERIIKINIKEKNILNKSIIKNRK